MVETITPEKAREYLNTTQGEGKPRRALSQIYVSSYADTMRKGRWMLNGEAIIFDINGVLINGCHRMAAVIEAGIPVAFEVIRGINPEAFTTYDNGRHRTVGQLLCMQGVKNYNLIASIVITSERLKKSGRLYESNTSHNGRVKVSNDDNYLIYSRDMEGYDEAGNFISKLVSRGKYLSGSWAGGLYYYLTHTGGWPTEKVKSFLECVFSSETTEIEPANLLRKRVTETFMQGKRLEASMLFALIAKAWNAYVDCIPMKRLLYCPDKESDYPRLRLNR